MPDRTPKRPITPQLLGLFRRQGRGQGAFEDYTAWHRVRRSDPPSRGRSHLHSWRGRQLDLMSDLEWTGLLFASQLHGLIDVREQFPLSLDAATHELGVYDATHAGRWVPGTLELARRLRTRHPQVRDDRTVEPNVLTTHHLLTLHDDRDRPQLLAVSYRHRFDGVRRGLLAIEASYWAERGVPWLLVTTSEFDRAVGLTLRRAAGWALGPVAGDVACRLAVQTSFATLGHSLSRTLQILAARLGDLDLAQRALWQAVWQGDLPMDLRRGWRPHGPIQLMSLETWSALNPLASRRSAWMR
jgi:hypothetical protein